MPVIFYHSPYSCQKVSLPTLDFRSKLDLKSPWDMESSSSYTSVYSIYSSRDLFVVVFSVVGIVDVTACAAAVAGTVGCCCGVKGDAVVAVSAVSRLKIRGKARRVVAPGTCGNVVDVAVVVSAAADADAAARCCNNVAR